MGRNVSASVKPKRGLGVRAITSIVRDYPLYVMLLLASTMTLLFNWMPLTYLVMAFKKYDLIDGLRGTPWVGFKYFIEVFQDPFFWPVTRNTLKIGILSMVFSSVAPIVLALSLNEVGNLVFKRIVQSISYVPYFISTVVIVGLLFQLTRTDGIVNEITESVFGFTLDYRNDSRLFIPQYIFITLWQTVGYSSIIYLAALSGIDPQLYEAAYIDGVGRLGQTIHVTLPGLFPTIAVLMIINVGNIVKVSFEKVLLMYNPAVYEVADVFQTYVYRRGIEGTNFSFATAMGLLNSVVAFLLVVVTNAIVKRLSAESVW